MQRKKIIFIHEQFPPLFSYAGDENGQAPIGHEDRSQPRATLSRRDFLGVLAAGAPGLLLGCRRPTRPIVGSFIDDLARLGHRIRDQLPFATPRHTVKVSVVIVGGGIAGLSAAWRLHSKGFTDFVLLEMEPQAGGTSRWGENEVSAFPWGAHYVPVPNRKSRIEKDLFRELGLIRPDSSWNERHLCRQPQERLFLKGRWQKGLHPMLDATGRDREHFRRFYGLIDRYRDSQDFTIPLDQGGGLSDLDRISMSEWVRRNDLDSPYLRWYLDYACRDDYGASLDAVSAWAGIHYFACREDPENLVFTWPEGNGWIVKRLLARVGHYVRTGRLVYRIVRGPRVKVFTEPALYLADAVIFAAPTFLAPYLVEDMPPLDRTAWQYSPWLVANLVLERPPKNGWGEPLAWDNVIYGSPTLGYVVANHQSGAVSDRMVWTLYWALAQGPPPRGRVWLLSRDWSFWKEAILRELEAAHPDIRSCVSRIDILRMGHAMARPVVGAIFHPQRRQMAAQTGDLVFANSDLSGFAIFEEAQYRGVMAANRALERIGG